MAAKRETKFNPARPAKFLAVIVGDVEPEIKGPYESDVERVLVARAHRRADPQMRDGLFRIDYHPKKGITIDSFAGREINNVDEKE